MRTLGILWVLFWGVGCSSSGEQLYFESFEDGWGQKNVLAFNFDNQTVSESVNMFLYIRNSEDYPFANIHLITDLIDPLGTTTTDTLTYRLAAPDGRWLGKGLLTKESKLWYKEKLALPYIGTYKIRVRHAMRHNEDEAALETLDGIVGVGVGVEKVE